MHRQGRWLVMAAVVLCGSLAVSCGSGSGGGGGLLPLTGVIVQNSATNQFGLSNGHNITRVDIGGVPAIVLIQPGQSLFMPTAAGSHIVNVLYSNASNEWAQTPPDPVTVAANQTVAVNFIN